MKILPSPVTVFRRRRGRPTVLAPWMLVSAATILLAFFTLSITQRASVHLLADIDNPALTESVRSQLDRMRWLSVGLAPAHVMVRWTVTAGLFWALGTFLLGGVSFRRGLSVAAYAGLPAVLGAALDLAVTWYQGPEFTTGMVPVMESASSLAVLLPAIEGPPYVAALIRNLTAFSLWGLALWVVGLRETSTHPVSWVRSAAVGGAVWCVFLLSSSAADTIRTSMLQMAMP